MLGTLPNLYCRKPQFICFRHCEHLSSVGCKIHRTHIVLRLKIPHIVYGQTKFSSQPSIEYPDIMKTTSAVALGAAKKNYVVIKLPTNVAWTARPWSIHQYLAIDFTMIAIWLAEYVID